ncbi:MAG: metal-dependent transcriptional regulator [Clostridia bacterium]|nr:metal-dependent transcriptional regulator [Clostridia bacterium]
MKNLQYLTASLEDYLEIIHILRQSVQNVGVTDIAKALGLSKPSVTRAIKSLKNNSLVIQEKYGKIVLTPEGEKIAESVYSKHKVLRKFLKEVLGISEGTAEIDACKIEHVISKETLEGVEKFLKDYGIEG